jgi:SAM-dependent methyltransferase
MTDAFGQYAGLYDLFYRDKDYGHEAAYVDGLIRRFHPRAVSLIDLGCGTGRHAREFARLGYTVTGVDRSEQMIASAHEHGWDGDPTRQPELVCGDLRSFRDPRRFDVATALFHVMNYQTGDEDIAAAIDTACRLLVPGGLFVFDFWYGPGVLAAPPTTRVRRIRHGATEVIRISEPAHDPARHRVDVNFDILSITDGSLVRQRELHSMRYLFVEELDRFLDAAGMDRIDTRAWLAESEPDDANWYACVVAKKRVPA